MESSLKVSKVMWYFWIFLVDANPVRQVEETCEAEW